jgi:hypothetical protein
MMYVVRCGIPQSVRRSLLTARYHSCKSIVVAGPGFLTSQPSPIKYSPQSRVVSTSSSTRHLRAGSVVAPVRTLRRAVLVDRSAYLGALRSLSSCESPLHVRISPTPARFSIVIRCAGIGLGVACLLTTVLKTCLLFLAGDRSPSWTLSALVSRPASAFHSYYYRCICASLHQVPTTAVYRCFDRRNSTLKRLSRSHPGSVIWAVTHILAVDVPTTSVSCTTALLAYCTRSCFLRWQGKTPCITLLPASKAVTHDSAGPAFSYVFHTIFFSKLFPRMIAMMFSHHHHHRPEKSS